jgi:DNA invertase Pin-like site-specific DNA recombinase
MGWLSTTAHEPEGGKSVRVAEYVRMSTDHQRYSTENQHDTIRKYAAQHGMVVVRTYGDEGKSGLSLEGRAALKQLIQDVQTGTRDFEAILVYDISRWGRFQDADESAYYEYLCRRSGIKVFYCAEPFENDGSPMATIMKSVKRAMAGEYSRELSNKVFQGQCRLVELGFHQGGTAGFGLRRMLIDEHHAPKGTLSIGECKSLQTDRVVLVHGPEEETETVRHIYQQFLSNGKVEQEIADELNAIGLRTDLGRSWTRGTVHQVLTNEKYIGNNVYNRISYKLKQRRVKNTPDMWIRCDGAFEPIVPLEWFLRVQKIVASRSRNIDSESMLKLLRHLYERTGALSGLLIDEQVDMPSSSAYRTRFGSLTRAYSLIGFRPRRDYRYVEINRQLRAKRPEVASCIVDGLEGAGAYVRQDKETGLLTVNDEFTLSIVIARCFQLISGTFRWHLRFEASLAPDVTVVVRMASDQSTVLDYYLFPRIDLPLPAVRLAEEGNAINLDAYRFDDLEILYVLSERFHLSKLA